MENIKTQKLSDRYEDLGLLGRGGMGEVRRVFDQVLGRAVAMKLIHPDRSSDEFLSRFVEEAQLSARLQHPNLLPIHDLGYLPNGQLYFTMKIAEGESLSKLIQKLHQESSKEAWVMEGKPYSLRRLLNAFKQVCDAVAYAHQRGVIHRDIKPENIIIGYHGTVQLIDWGIAKRQERYFSEWINEVVGHFRLELTPVSELIDPSRPHLSEMKDESQISIIETMSESLLEESANLMPTYSIDSTEFMHGTSVDQGHQYSEEALDINPSENSINSRSTIHVDHVQEDSQLSRFSVSSEDLISMNASVLTQRSSHGSIAGTLEYMAPEQLAAQVQNISYPSDIFGLGVVLYEILVGQSPFKLSKSIKKESLYTKLQESKIRREVKLEWPKSHPFISDELKQICSAALHPDFKERTQNASDVAESLVRYLDGVGRREQGLEKVKEAEKAFEQATALKQSAQRLLSEGKQLQKTQKMSDSIWLKQKAWQKLDKAQSIEEQALQLEFRAERALYDALLYDHTLNEAHSLLALYSQKAHVLAEQKGNRSEASHQAMLIESHLEYADATLATRLRHYLSNTALVKAQFKVPKQVPVEITAQAYTLQDRHLVLGPPEVWSSSPSLTKEVALGSYLLTIKAEGYQDLVYPIYVERERGWDGIDPDGSDLAIPMISSKIILPPGLKYVPQGWFYAGGDPLVSNSVDEKKRLWLDGFFMAESHVTHRHYLSFLRDLCQQGDYELAYHLRPRLRDEEGEGLYHFSQGKVELNENEFVRLDWPANYTNYESAIRYAEWFSKKVAMKMRLPTDMEWEKVARNVDARSFPWGEYFDPAFVHMRLSVEQARPGKPNMWNIDQSPWGQYGLSGSMRDWTCTLFTSPFPYEEGQRVSTPELEERNNTIDERVVRGGSWKTQEGNCRSAFRFVASPNYRDDDGSFRLAFSLSDLSLESKEFASKP